MIKVSFKRVQTNGIYTKPLGTYVGYLEVTLTYEMYVKS